MTLQNKVAELNEKLQQSSQTNPTQVERMALSSHRDIPAAPMVDTRQKAVLRKIEVNKQKNLHEAHSELEILRADYSKIQQQCCALRGSKQNSH